jgi:hypothetical protein
MRLSGFTSQDVLIALAYVLTVVGTYGWQTGGLGKTNEEVR